MVTYNFRDRNDKRPLRTIENDLNHNGYMTYFVRNHLDSIFELPAYGTREDGTDHYDGAPFDTLDEIVWALEADDAIDGESIVYLVNGDNTLGISFEWIER